MPACLGSFAVESGEKMSVWSKYLAGLWRGPLQRLAGQFVLGKKDEHSWPPKSSPGWMPSAPQRLHHRPLGPSPQIPSHRRVQPAWLSARHTAKGKEKHIQEHLRSGVGYQKGLLEESNLSQLVLERKARYGHRDQHSFFSIFSDSNRVSKTRNASQGSKELQSSKWRSSRLSLVFWGVSVLPQLKTLCRVVTLLVIIETSDLKGSLQRKRVLPAVLDASTPVTGVESFSPCSAFLRHCFLFFSFRVSLSELSPFSDREEYRCEECRGLYWAFLEEAEVLSREFRVGEASDLATVVWARRLPRGKRWSISLRKEGGWRLLTVSSTNASQLSSSLSRCSIWARAWVFLERIEWGWTLA